MEHVARGRTGLPLAVSHRVVYGPYMVRAVVLLWLLGCGSVDAASTPDAARPDAAMSDAGPQISGLVAWYRMDALANRVVSDATGAHNGACGAGACPLVNGDGRIDGAYVFDGIDDLVRVLSVAELETATGFTVTAWINRASATADACIVNKGFGANGNNSWQFCVRADGAPAFFSAATTGTDALTSDALLATARWYHVALWWNGTTKAIYLDGARLVFKDSVAISFDASDITIGGDIDAGALVDPFNGMIDDVRIYNRALSNAELTALQSP